MRRALRLGETEAVPRISDLDALAASTSGKVEIETIDEGRDGQVVERLIQQAVLTVFKASVPAGQSPRRGRRTSTRRQRVVHAGDDIPSARSSRCSASSRPCASVGARAWPASESPAAVASATEFVLEGLHLSKRLNKDAAGTRATYRAR